MPLTARPQFAALASSSVAFFLAFTVACAEEAGPSTGPFVVDVDPDGGVPGS